MVKSVEVIPPQKNSGLLRKSGALPRTAGLALPVKSLLTNGWIVWNYKYHYDDRHKQKPVVVFNIFHKTRPGLQKIF